MKTRVLGARLRTARLRRQWSQSGLCEGICAVSYLSKIEQGKADASEEILRLLFERLELPWMAEGSLAEAQALTQRMYDAVLEGRWEDAEKERTALLEQRDHQSPFALDMYLLCEVTAPNGTPLDASLEPALDSRQLALQRVLQERYDEAVQLCPEPYFYYKAGSNAYFCGEGDARTMELLQRGFALAAQEGFVHLMLECRVLMGNCCSNRLAFENMCEHYRVARRLAVLLDWKDRIRDIDYNIAATQLELGHYDEAYAYFSTLKEPLPMDLHKLAICCEKRGLREEALAALERIEPAQNSVPDAALQEQMCAVVRYRLLHEDYLRREEYGQMLLDCFATIRKKLPIGFASFHLPWVLEWLTATRQYKQAYGLMCDFPIKAKNV